MKKRIVIWLLVFAAVLLCVAAAGAESGTCGKNINWELDADGVLTISGTGTVDPYGGGISPDWAQKKIRKIVLEEGITGIGWHAFSNFADLAEVTFPEGFTDIGVGAFVECVKLRELRLPESLKKIDSYAFQNCDALTAVRIPGGVAELGTGAFMNCDRLREVTMVPGIKAIGNDAFKGCECLKTVWLPEGLEEIRNQAFQNCPVLSHIDLPDSLTTLGQYAFEKTALESVDLPDGITEFDYGPFPPHCVKYAAIGSITAKTLGENDCMFQVPGNDIRLMYLYEDGNLIGLEAHYCPQDVEIVTIPEGVTILKESLFSSRESIKEIHLPESLTTIQDHVFWNLNATVWFKGDAPVFSENAFKYASLMAVVPEGRNGWAEAIQKTYGAWVLQWYTGDPAVAPDTPKDETEALSVTATSNSGSQEYYSVWEAGRVDASLNRLEDGGWLRVEHKGNSVIVEEYTAGLQLKWKKTLPVELPLWGGFYHGKNYNFLVFGQKNMEEDDNKEVMRIVRYSANWHRMDAVSISHANTVDPFSFGTLRMTQYEDYLLIHTCHRMYKLDDGLNHQSNMSYRLYIPTMTLLREDGTGVNLGGDYVSHSFNQFVITDGEDVVKVDHGDAYPRGIYLQKQSGSAGTPGTNYSDAVILLSFPHVEGRQYQNTGAQVGGLEATNQVYVVAGKSIDQTTGTGNRMNIFVATVPKNSINEKSVRFRWLTHYTAKNPTVSNPQLVRISGKQLLLLWTESGTDTPLKYTVLNEKGEPGVVYSAAAVLSDCKPIVTGHKVVWYVSGSSHVTLYEIDVLNPAMIRAVEMGGEGITDPPADGAAAHTLTAVEAVEATCTAPGQEAYWVCSECGRMFSDAACTQEISAPVKTEAKGHTLKAVEKVAPTCEKAGMEAYWKCETCGWLFSDAAGETGLLAPVKIPALGHTGERTWLRREENGWIATDIYELDCTTCGKKVTIRAKSSLAKMPGDVNGDKVFDGRDVIRLMKYLSGDEDVTVDDIDEANADVTLDGKVDERDLLRIIRYLGDEEDYLLPEG